VFKHRRPPRPLTPERLEKAALAYLERYASSAANLKRVLLRRIERAVRAGVAERSEGMAQVDMLIERYRARGLIDDRTYAEGRVRTLRREGRSRHAIVARLFAKGVSRAEIDDTLARFDAESPNAELQAALAFARRRRLGPYRGAATRAANRVKDLAALARGGFSLDTARRILDAASPGEIAAKLAEQD
jgi:regulatory protein